MKEYLLSSNADNQRYDYFDKAIKSGEIKLEGNRIIYVNALGSIEQNYSDPEEKVRALVYSELLYHYEYNARIIHIELPIKLKTDVFADISL